MPINIADVITEFGAYYKNNGQNMNSLLRLMYAQTDTTKYMTPVMVDGTRWEAAKFTIGQVLQPFQKAVTPAGSATFKPLKWDLYHFKMDIKESPDDVEASWLGFLGAEGVKRTEWPLVRFMIEQVLAKAARDYELAEIYKGVYAAPTVGTAGAAGTAMNGIGKIIADAITATTITPITLGAISTNAVTFVEQVETFTRSIVGINEDYANVPMNIHLNPTLGLRYKQGYREKYGNQSDFTGTEAKVIDTNFTVAPLSSMTGRSRIFATPKENFVDLRFRNARQGQIEVQPKDREVQILGDHWRGVGFKLLEAVFCNELA
jgi:hypothetical protein